MPDTHPLFELAAVGIAKVSYDGRFLAVNPTLTGITGYSNEELLQKSFKDITHPDDLDKSLDWKNRLISGELTEVKGEKRYLRKDGSIVWMALSIKRGEGFFITVFEDISERKAAQDLLHDQRDVLEQMAQSLPLKVVLENIVRMIERQAPGAVSTIYLLENNRLRVGALPSLPKEFSDAVDGAEIGPQAGTCGAAAFHGRRVVSTDVTRDDCWGRYRDWILSYGIRSCWSTPVLGNDGKVLGTVSMCWRELRQPTARDFELVDAATRLMSVAIERQRTENLIHQQQAKMMASSKMAALGEMAGGLAHEINNPLAIVHGLAGQLEQLSELNDLDEAKVADIARRIQATAMRISKIVKGLRSFAREGENDPFQRTLVKTVIEDTLSLCGERFKTYGIKVKVGVIEDSLAIECRAVQICQVLLNLLNNSFDAVQNLADKWIVIEATSERDGVLISVTDSGRGIPQELREKIMQPFFTTKPVGMGTGLGLSIASGIVAAHRGELSLDSSSPQTKLCVWLPKQQAATP